MPMLRGFLVLVLFFILGESVRLLLALPVSGGVLGMVVITFTLMLKGNVSDDLARASQGLISVLVLLIMPGSKQAWPTVAACWSPAMPAIRIGAPNSAGSVLPKSAAQSFTSGNSAAGTLKILSSSSSQS